MEDEVNHLSAVSVGLSSEDGDEDKDNGVIFPVLGVLDDGVSDQANGSEVLETVAGQKEAHSEVFKAVSNNGVIKFLAHSTRIINCLNFLNQFSKFSFGFKIVGILGYFIELPH